MRSPSVPMKSPWKIKVKVTYILKAYILLISTWSSYNEVYTPTCLTLVEMRESSTGVPMEFLSCSIPVCWEMETPEHYQVTVVYLPVGDLSWGWVVSNEASAAPVGKSGQTMERRCQCYALKVWKGIIFGAMSFQTGLFLRKTYLNITYLG